MGGRHFLKWGSQTVLFLHLNAKKMIFFAFEILEIEFKCKIFDKILTKSLGIASKLQENDPEEGKNTKISACGGLGSKKEF